MVKNLCIMASISWCQLTFIFSGNFLSPCYPPAPPGMYIWTAIILFLYSPITPTYFSIIDGVLSTSSLLPANATNILKSTYYYFGAQISMCVTRATPTSRAPIFCKSTNQLPLEQRTKRAVKQARLYLSEQSRRLGCTYTSWLGF